MPSTAFSSVKLPGSLVEKARGAGDPSPPPSVDALTARLLAAQARGSLAQRVRDVVQDNSAHID